MECKECIKEYSEKFDNVKQYQKEIKNKLKKIEERLMRNTIFSYYLFVEYEWQQPREYY